MITINQEQIKELEAFINTIPMQATASDILGLPFKELNYGINLLLH